MLGGTAIVELFSLISKRCRIGLEALALESVFRPNKCKSLFCVSVRVGFEHVFEKTHTNSNCIFSPIFQAKEFAFL